MIVARGLGRGAFVGAIVAAGLCILAPEEVVLPSSGGPDVHQHHQQAAWTEEDQRELERYIRLLTDVYALQNEKPEAAKPAESNAKAAETSPVADYGAYGIWPLQPAPILQKAATVAQTTPDTTDAPLFVSDEEFLLAVMMAELS
jgi:hypothetical protein